MQNKLFTVYPGTFMCKECDEVVKTMRLWKESGEASWMCNKKHISKVQLLPIKKRKKDYENE